MTEMKCFQFSIFVPIIIIKFSNITYRVPTLPHLPENVAVSVLIQ